VNISAANFVEMEPKRLKTDEQKFLTFNFGKLSHPIFGTSTKELAGRIPLFTSIFSPSQVLQIPALKMEEFKALGEKTFDNYHELFEDDLDEDIIEKVTKKALAVAFLNPATVLNSNHQQGEHDHSLTLQVLFIIEACENIINDLMPTDTTTDPEGSAHHGPTIIGVDKRVEQFLQVMGHYFSSKNDDDKVQLPLVTPAVKVIIQFSRRCYWDLRKGVPDFKTRIQPFKKEVEKAMYAYLSKGKDLQDGKGESMDFGFSELQCTILKELFSFLNHAEVPVEVRKSEGFKKFALKCPEICGILRTILSLGNDVKEERIPNSSILRSIVMRRTIKDLQQGFDLYYERLMKGLEEMREGAQQLRTTYPNDEKLEKYIQGVENYFNGELYWYSHTRGFPIN
jgi:hypothetical protein